MTPATHHDQLDSISIHTDSAASTPRADHLSSAHQLDQPPPRLRFMCSFGGKILPRPHDNQLRYVGGDTRIIAVSRHTSFSALLSKLAKIAGTPNISVKYQLPNEDLDALISVSNDEDVENMMDEYERIGSRTARLRLFLFHDQSRTSSISSLLDGSTRRESWFLDALNGGGGGSTAGAPLLERGLSEASSIVSEVPDYLFGLDNSDDPAAAQLREPKARTRSNLADCISYSDPGSPAPVLSSTPFSSASPAAIQSVPDLPPVKTKMDNPAPPIRSSSSGRPVEAVNSIDPPISIPAGSVQSNTVWRQYNPEPHYPGLTAVTSVQPMPVYYIPGPVHPGNYPVQPVPVQAQYVQLQPPSTGQQLPVGYLPAGMGMGAIHGVPAGGMMRPIAMDLDTYEGHGRLVSDGYYGPVQVYPGQVTAASAGERAAAPSEAMGS
uniref:PB1 domain-containing protein n=1 Tax=Kalanchoe fedtschenkoi TaxID=63787 RepID=A0A7N0UQB0_KALFE